MNTYILTIIAFLLYVSLMTQCTKGSDPELIKINSELRELNRNINSIKYDVDILNDKTDYK